MVDGRKHATVVSTSDTAVCPPPIMMDISRIRGKPCLSARRPPYIPVTIMPPDRLTTQSSPPAKSAVATVFSTGPI